MQKKNKLDILLQRSDFRTNPLKAVGRRLWWRIRWHFSTEPMILPLNGTLQVVAPKTGGGALLYYLGHAEPETANFLEKNLKAGQTFIDIGAHIGEYTLMASQIVGSAGSVHCFEPHPEVRKCLQDSIKLNKINNCYLNATAISNQKGQMNFGFGKEASISSLIASADEKWPQVTVVETETLDFYCEKNSVRPNLIKIDVEGAENQVMQGAAGLLAKPKNEAPIVIFEYNKENYEKFDTSLDQMLKFFQNYGYQVHLINTVGVLDSLDKMDPNGTYNLAAIKAEVG